MPYTRPTSGNRPQGKATGALGALVQAEKMMQIALLLPSAAFIGWLIGGWLGEHLHQHWMAAAGIVFGGISGLVYVIQMALHAAKNAEFDVKDDDKPGNGGAGTPS